MILLMLFHVYPFWAAKSSSGRDNKRGLLRCTKRYTVQSAGLLNQVESGWGRQRFMADRSLLLY